MTAPRSKRKPTKRNHRPLILPGSPPLDRLRRMIAAESVAKADATRDSREATEGANPSCNGTSNAWKQT